MQDTDTTAISQQSGTLRDEALTSLPKNAGKKALNASAALGELKAPTLLQRLLGFFSRLLRGARRKKTVYIPDQAATDRLAAAHAAQLPPPMAFKGDTANTLATPIGSYAGKPVEHAMRKRAEQQFKNMDITQTTIH